MDFFKKAGFFIFVAFVLFIFVWALYVPKEEVSEIIQKTIAEQKDKSDLFYKKVIFKETHDGIKYWEIKAKTSSINKTKSIALLKDTEGLFFEKGKPSLKFIAPKAVWLMDKKEITLENPIGYDVKASDYFVKSLKEKIMSSKNFFNFSSGARDTFFFKAENLEWNMKDQKLVCDKGIWIQKGNIDGTAKTLKGNVSLEKVEISGNPKILVKNGKEISILKAPVFYIDSTKNTISAFGPVSLEANEILIKTQTATFEQDINLISLDGSIEALYKNFVAKSDHGNYDIKKQTVALFGSPLLSQGESFVSGKEITVDVKKRNFSIRGGTKILIPEKEIKK